MAIKHRRAAFRERWIASWKTRSLMRNLAIFYIVCLLTGVMLGLAWVLLSLFGDPVVDRWMIFTLAALAVPAFAVALHFMIVFCLLAATFVRTGRMNADSVQDALRRSAKFVAYGLSFAGLGASG
jgi:membrane-anchored glycerophosphoryl diester phosphodiesterase (GDPDase)